MGDLERRLVEQFESHEQTAAALVPDDADNETIALQRSTAQYVALKEALIEIGRAIDHLAENRPVDLEHRLDELRELVVSAKPAKRKKKNS